MIQFMIFSIVLITGLRGPIDSPGLFSSAIVLAQARPNTTKSNRELAPSRLAPWTDAQAASPHAYKPATTLSWLFSLVNTWPL